MTAISDALSRHQAPHCDQRILHAPGECVYCDKRPDAQDYRIIWAIAFTGKPAPEGGLPCPADAARGNGHGAWGGNRAVKKLPHHLGCCVTRGCHTACSHLCGTPLSCCEQVCESAQ